MAKSDSFQERLIRDIAELKTEVRLGTQKIEAMDQRINGRLKKLEKTVFGDEEAKVIGLTEAARAESREIKSLNKKWGVAIAVVVFFAQYVGNWVSDRMGWGRSTDVIETAAQASDISKLAH